MLNRKTTISLALVGLLATGALVHGTTRHRQRWRSRPADPYRKSQNFPPFDFDFDDVFDVDDMFDFDDDERKVDDEENDDEEGEAER